MEPTPTVELDRIVTRLDEHRGAWAAVSLDDRVGLLEKLLAGVLAVSEEWVGAAHAAKGLDPDVPASGEEWLAGPLTTVRNLRLLQRALVEVRDHGAPRIPTEAMSQRADGRLVVRVFPQNVWDRILLAGFRAEVWMQPGVTRENLREHQAGAYRHPDTAGKVAVVLGAGNVSSIAPMDALYKLFVENQVVVLKMNPVNEYLGPFFRRAFAPLVDAGFFEVVYGGADVGARLCHHPRVHTVHITGSDATHDAIVWGPREGRAERKARHAPVLTKEITSELGNVTPIIVVPGAWTSADIQFQAENVATMVANNGSFNCNAGKLLVTARDWEHRDAFLTAVRRVLATLPNRKAYYPGASERWQGFVNAHPQAERLSAESEGTLPWTFIGDLDPENRDDTSFRQEPFCSVLSEVPLPGRSAVEFLPGAVDFCNDTVWGTLACMVLVHPSTRKDPASEAAFQDALDTLEYGGIGVNHWAGLVYGFVTPTWGAYPGHTLEDIQSGRGVVHNTCMFDRPEKSIVYGPFSMFPRPPWFATNRRTHRIAPRLTAFEANPSVWKIPGILVQALGG
jgi:hypothetical protein